PLGLRRTVCQEQEATGQHDGLDPLHRNLDSLCLIRHSPGTLRGTERAPPVAAKTSSRRFEPGRTGMPAPPLLNAPAGSGGQGCLPAPRLPARVPSRQWGWTAVPMKIADKNVKM